MGRLVKYLAKCSFKNKTRKIVKREEVDEIILERKERNHQAFG